MGFAGGVAVKIELVTIGDELLLGFTIDTNAAHLARELVAIGVEIVRRATVGDDPQEIAAAVREAPRSHRGRDHHGWTGAHKRRSHQGLHRHHLWSSDACR